MGERSGAPTTVRVARSRPGLRAAVATTAVLLLLAVLKPWAPAIGATGIATRGTPPNGAASSPARASGAAVAPTRSPVVAADAGPGPGEMTCQVEDWQVVSLDRLADWTVRTWTPAAAAAAGGPLDPTIPAVRLDSPRVLALGVCVPDASGGREPTGEGRIASIWRLVARRAVDVTFAPLVADPARGPRPGIASLYRPVQDPSAWAPGRYVIALDVPGPAGNGGGRHYLGVVVPANQ